MTETTGRTSGEAPFRADGARFDWYAATIREDPDDIIRALEDTFSAEAVPCRAKNAYLEARELRREDRTVATVLYGGPNGWPHVWASGDNAPKFAELCRLVWRDDHHVTRMDSAVDYDDSTAWDALYGILRATADERRLKLATVGDWLRPGSPDGRTLYVGSFKSPVFVRLYEKGKQMRAQEPTRRYSDDWVRLEVQVRPQKDARFSAATATPADAWGYARWTTDVAAEAFALDVERVQAYEDREADDERALFYLVKQYGAVLGRLAESLGSWDRVGADLLGRVERQKNRDRY